MLKMLSPQMTDLSSEERDGALATAVEMLAANERGKLWAELTSLRWAVEDLVRLAQAVARYCPAGVPRTLPPVIATEHDRTTPTLAAGTSPLNLPASGVLGVMDAEISDGIVMLPSTDDAARTNVVVEHTRLQHLPDGSLAVVKRNVGYPIDGNGRSGEM